MNIKLMKIFNMNAYVEHNVRILFFIMHCVNNGGVLQHNKPPILNVSSVNNVSFCSVNCHLKHNVMECQYIIEYTIIVSTTNLYKLYLHSVSFAICLLGHIFVLQVVDCCHKVSCLGSFSSIFSMANPIIMYTLQACIHVYILR